jgi:hypothetical protein
MWFFLHVYFKTKLLMEIFTLNLFDSSFELVLRSYKFCPISTYKYEIIILLDDHLLSLQVKKININFFNQF